MTRFNMSAAIPMQATLQLMERGERFDITFDFFGAGYFKVEPRPVAHEEKYILRRARTVLDALGEDAAAQVSRSKLILDEALRRM